MEQRKKLWVGSAVSFSEPEAGERDILGIFMSVNEPDNPRAVGGFKVD